MARNFIGVGAQLGSIVLAGLLPRAALAAQLSTAPDPVAIVNGDIAEACAWPSVVALEIGVEDPVYCSGVLVAPELVLTAAHCLADPGVAAIIFGDTVADAARRLDVVECVAHPGWTPANDVQDIGFCRLASAVDDVPIVAPLMGCEADLLMELPRMVVVAGFGADYAHMDAGDDTPTTSGYGVKRLTVIPLVAIFEDSGLAQVNGAAGSGPCYGDSGGPVIAQLDDGTFRVFGVAAEEQPITAVDPCVGAQSYYQLIAPQAGWIEDASGIDFTPCHDADGTWNPDERCTEFPTSPFDGGGVWTSGCAEPDAVTGPIASCGAPYAPSADDGGSSDAGSGSEASSGDAPTTDPSDGSSGTAAASEDTSGGAPANDEDDSGCGCGTQPRSRAAFFALLVLAARRRRRSTLR